MRAAQLDTARGYATLRRDLVTVADAPYAVEVLAELAEREQERPRAALVATEAARAALDAAEPARALVLARLALEKHAGHGEALELAEVASRAVARAHEMSPLYDHVARRALGRCAHDIDGGALRVREHAFVQVLRAGEPQHQRNRAVAHQGRHDIWRRGGVRLRLGRLLADGVRPRPDAVGHRWTVAAHRRR